MRRMREPQTVKSLKIWQKSVDLVVVCHRASAKFPNDERFGLISQIRRAAVPIPANIAEGYGRWNSREFARFLAIASGSARELETHLIVAEKLGYLSTAEAVPVLRSVDEVARMIFAMLAKTNSTILTKNAPGASQRLANAATSLSDR